MDFTLTDIRTFKQLYKKHFDVTLDDKLATIKLAMLVKQLEIVYQPITSSQISRLEDVDGNNYEQTRSTSGS